MSCRPGGCRSTAAACAPAGSRPMAQLSDDCFAFAGPLMPVDEVDRLIARARRPGGRDRDGDAVRRAAGRVLGRRHRRRRSICRRSTIRRSTAMRCATADLDAGRRDAPRDRRSRRGRPQRATRALAAGDRDPHLHRRADAGGRRHRLHAGGLPRRGRRRHRAARPEARRQPAARRRGHARGRGRAARPAGASRRSTWRSPPPSASPSSTCGGACGLRCSRPATRSSSRDRRCRARRSTIRTAACSPRCWRACGAEVTDLGILRDRPEHARARDRRGRAPRTISC